MSLSVKENKSFKSRRGHKALPQNCRKLLKRDWNSLLSHLCAYSDLSRTIKREKTWPEKKSETPNNVLFARPDAVVPAVRRTCRVQLYLILPQAGLLFLIDDLLVRRQSAYLVPKPQLQQEPRSRDQPKIPPSNGSAFKFGMPSLFSRSREEHSSCLPG